jgi:prepilin peptidase CpaA
MIIDTLRLLLFPALMAFAASSDLFSMTISNKVSLALVGGFVVLALAAGMSPTEMGSHAGAGLVVLIAAFACFTQGWIGGGDAKLAAATSLWFGFAQLLHYLVDAALLGGVLSLAVVNFRMLPLPAAISRWEWIARLHRKGEGVPYGIALAAAALLIYPETVWMKSLAA